MGSRFSRRVEEMEETPFQSDSFVDALETDDEILFAPEDSSFIHGPTLLAPDERAPWRVLVVDDDSSIHKVTEITLRDETIDGRAIELLTAETADQAREILRKTPDVALALLDVVMESEHAGLELVRWIRGELRNRLVRIVLRTGQQGVAPEDRIMSEYEINDYWAKTDMTAHRLVTIVVGAIRAYRDLCTVSRAGARELDDSGEPKTLGRYLVLKRIGAGGMGVVYAAYDPELDRKLAIKLMHDQASDTEAQKRLLREAQAMARLSHPNVVAVFDVGTHEGRVFLAMDYVEGITLTEWIERTSRTTEEILDMFVKAGRGLAAAHAAGLVHRDFKPDNVLVGRKRTVKVTDFGLVLATEAEAEINTNAGIESIEVSVITRGSRRRSGSALDDPLTDTGMVMGTPNYMAPEQHLGQEATARTDVFSFCMALYEALYATKPFEGSNLAVRLEACFSGSVAPAPRNTNIPGQLRRIVVRGLAWDPAKRWPSMTKLLAALERPMGGALSRRLALGIGGVAVVGFGIYGLALIAPKRELTIAEKYAATAYDDFENAKSWLGDNREESLGYALNAAKHYRLAGDAYASELDRVQKWIVTNFDPEEIPQRDGSR